MDFYHSIEQKGYCVVELNAHNMRNEQVDTRYNAIAICDCGEALLEANLLKFNMRKGTRLLLNHVMLTRQISVSPDFHAWILVVSDRFWLDMMVGVPTEMIEAAFSQPMRHIDNTSEWKMLNNFIENIRLYDSLDYTNHSVEVAGAIFRCMVMTMAEVEMREGKYHPVVTYTMADSYFRKFIVLIDEHVKREHEVSFYANQLSITPKYLSEICKQKSGHKAKEIISGILISKIKRDIIMSGKSIKVIAYDYCFSDQSSLGKFFRKMIGQSPSTFKRLNGVGDNSSTI